MSLRDGEAPAGAYFLVAKVGVEPKHLVPGTEILQEVPGVLQRRSTPLEPGGL